MVRVEECVELNAHGSAHGSDNDLEQYAMGRLLEAEIGEIEEHLLVCPECREKVDDFDNVAISMRAALAADRLKPERQFGAWIAAALRRPVVSMALGFALLIAVVAFFTPTKPKMAAIAALQLTANRGPMPATAPARELDVTLVDGPRDGGPFRVEMVNAGGAVVWQGLTENVPGGLRLDVRIPLGLGDYFVRLYGASGSVMREYGFRIRN
jgi:hypothetical protein